MPAAWYLLLAAGLCLERGQRVLRATAALDAMGREFAWTRRWWASSSPRRSWAALALVAGGAPPGDLLDRRRLMLAQVELLVLALAAVAWRPPRLAAGRDAGAGPARHRDDPGLACGAVGLRWPRRTSAGRSKSARCRSGVVIGLFWRRRWRAPWPTLWDRARSAPKCRPAWPAAGLALAAGCRARRRRT